MALTSFILASNTPHTGGGAGCAVAGCDVDTQRPKYVRQLGCVPDAKGDDDCHKDHDDDAACTKPHDDGYATDQPDGWISCLWGPESKAKEEDAKRGRGRPAKPRSKPTKATYEEKFPSSSLLESPGGTKPKKAKISFKATSCNNTSTSCCASTNCTTTPTPSAFGIGASNNASVGGAPYPASNPFFSNYYWDDSGKYMGEWPPATQPINFADANSQPSLNK